MKSRASRLQPPFLKRVWIDKACMPDERAYPYTLPLLEDGRFSFDFTRPVTIIVGENGSGKSSFLEGLAVLAGFDDAGGGPGYRPVDHSRAREMSGGELAKIFKASWLPKVTTGWFFKAETFFSVARYLDQAATDAGAAHPDFLSHSHGEGFLRFFGERCRRKGLFLFDEPESALSPNRQLEFLRLIRDIEDAGTGQLVIATHSPILMAYPGAALIEAGPRGFRSTTLEDTQHFKTLEAFFQAPRRVIDETLR